MVNQYPLNKANRVELWALLKDEFGYEFNDYMRRLTLKADL